MILSAWQEDETKHLQTFWRICLLGLEQAHTALAQRKNITRYLMVSEGIWKRYPKFFRQTKYIEK